MKYADICVDISHEKLDRMFQYEIPQALEEKAKVGSRVTIPFGRGNRSIKGYIVNITDEPSFDPARTKKIIGVDDKQVNIDSRMIILAYYIRERYGGTINDALKCVIPVKKVIKNKVNRYIQLAVDDKTLSVELAKYEGKVKYKSRYRLLKAFEDVRTISEELVYDTLNISKGVINSLAKEGVIKVVSEVEYRNPINIKASSQKNIKLNGEQKAISDKIISDYEKDIRRTYLIHGVTGSGKTEVYMEIIEHVVRKGRQVIMLIPEIALTYQTVKRFYARFKDRVSIMNSRLSAGERYDQYLRAKAGEIDIMIGPRSALFTPFENLGLIVIDEEHEGSYKSEMPPKYDARGVAQGLAAMTGASIILGSATPSVTTYNNAVNGNYELMRLSARAGGAKYPKVYIEDMRAEMKKGNKSIFSVRLNAMIEDRIAKKEQVMLFINRRGYSGFVSCRSCGHIIKCPHCDVSLTYHSPGFDSPAGKNYNLSGKLVCHYCGFEMGAAASCPECNSKFISIFGTGTQKVEAMAKIMYPQARILRMDADTTSEKNGHEKILSSFAQGDADILIGTQMIVKGHDFPNVTLVGVLAADLSLGSNDYRAAENTFQLLLQAAGRAGRGRKKGEVVIQTYRPDHYSVKCAADGDYERFYNHEIMYRKLMGYPPVLNMMSILVMSKNEDRAAELADDIKAMADRAGSDMNLTVLGPAAAMITKLNDMFRNVLYIKHADEKILIGLRNQMQKYIMDNERYRECIVHFDINPRHSI